MKSFFLRKSSFFQKIFFIFYFLLSLVFLIYISLPSPQFPNPPEDAIQSFEPGDSEDLASRRAYFSNYKREEVINHYRDQFSINLLGKKIFPMRLNYPPEDSQTLIRDQTRTTYLEELVFPFRESFFVNGNESGDSDSLIFIDGNFWWQKVTVRYYRSLPHIRILIGLFSIVVLWFVLNYWFMILGSVVKFLKRK